MAKALEAHGVKFVFTLVGGHISPILVAAESLGIRVIDTRHEASSGPTRPCCITPIHSAITSDLGDPKPGSSHHFPQHFFGELPTRVLRFIHPRQL